MTKRKDHDKETQDLVPQTFLDHLHIENMGLMERVERINAEISSPTFNTLEQEERERMLGQRTAMGHYLDILTARIAYYTNEGSAA